MRRKRVPNQTQLKYRFKNRSKDNANPALKLSSRSQKSGKERITKEVSGGRREDGRSSKK